MYGINPIPKPDNERTTQSINGCQNSHPVKCSICCKVVSFYGEDTGRLLLHLQRRHPEIRMARFLPVENRIKISSMSDGNKEFSKCMKTIRDKYEVSVELRKSATTGVVCESCGTFTTPIIKRKFTTDSMTAALFFFGCWPFCYLPYLMGGGFTNDTYSCCNKCGHVFTSSTTKEANKNVV